MVSSLMTEKALIEESRKAGSKVLVLDVFALTRLQKASIQEWKLKTLAEFQREFSRKESIM